MTPALLVSSLGKPHSPTPFRFLLKPAVFTVSCRKENELRSNFSFNQHSFFHQSHDELIFAILDSNKLYCLSLASLSSLV
jgi:hypothetical protein